MKFRYFCLCSVAGLLFAAAGSAQTISLLDVKVKDLQPQYELGRGIDLTPVSTPPDTLHVRVFYASIEQLKRTRPDRDHCIPFYTAILWGTGLPDVINLDAINNPNLVRRDRDGRWIAATVTLVFEGGDQPEPGAFRLKPEALDAYFRYAIEIHLAPSASQQRVEQQFSRAVEYGMRAAPPVVTPVMAAPAEVTEPPKPPCFSVNPHPDDEAGGKPLSPGVTLVATMAPTGCDQLPPLSPETTKPSGF
jgi:hypothetical protein